MPFSQWDLGGCCCGPGSCSISFTVKGCNSITYSGTALTIEVWDSTDTTLLGTATTSTGVATVTFTGATGTYHVHVTGQSARFAAYNVSQTLTCTPSSKTITLAPASTHVCAFGCLLPTSKTLHTQVKCGTGCTTDLTGGVVALTWDGTSKWIYSSPGSALSRIEINTGGNANLFASGVSCGVLVLASPIVCPPSVSLTYSGVAFGGTSDCVCKYCDFTVTE